MANRKPIEVGEWYHCYNRGVDKRKVFLEERDYDRLLLHMFLGKRPKPIQLFNERDHRLVTILRDSEKATGLDIVEIGAYALMPNHVHFLLKEIQEGGTALFMQKVFTGYTMYFNKKYERTGALFAGTFQSKHIVDDRYLKCVVSYIHLNPAELFNPQWKKMKRGLAILGRKVQQYPYSSLYDFYEHDRPERKIIGPSIFSLFES